MSAEPIPTPPPQPLPEFQNREEWLTRAVDAYFRAVFERLGYKIPRPIHLSVGWGRGRNGAESKDMPGQCWSGSWSTDGAPHVFISPSLGYANETADEDGNPVPGVLGVLAHMLVHAALDPFMDHGAEFRKLARALGLEGPMAATEVGNPLGAEFHLLTQDDGILGPYPHAKIEVLEFPAQVPQLVGVGPRRAHSGPAKQTGSRHAKVMCVQHPDNYVVRTSRAAVERGMGPLCGAAWDDDDGTPCGRRMTLIEE